MGGLRKVCKLLISRLARILANDSWSVTFAPHGGDDDAIDAGSVAGGIGVGEHDGVRTAAQLYG
jgi:hypothetical protein